MSFAALFNRESYQEEALVSSCVCACVCVCERDVYVFLQTQSVNSIGRKLVPRSKYFASIHTHSQNARPLNSHLQSSGAQLLDCLNNDVTAGQSLLSLSKFVLRPYFSLYFLVQK